MMIWENTSKSTIRCGEWCIIKWPWGSYCLWHKDTFVGRYDSAQIAKENAIAARTGEDSGNNPAGLAQGVRV
jgi:hypothetical protein